MLLLFFIFVWKFYLNIAPYSRSEFLIDSVNQFIESDKFIALSGNKFFRSLKLQTYIIGFTRVNILRNYFFSITENSAVHKNKTSVVRPGILSIVQQLPCFVESLPSFHFVTIMERFFNKLHLVFFLHRFGRFFYRLDYCLF